MVGGKRERCREEDVELDLLSRQQTAIAAGVDGDAV